VTIDSYKHIIDNHITPLIGNVKLCELTVMTVRRLLDIKLEKKLSSRTVRYIYTVLNAMVKQAAKDELIGKNVVSKVQKPKLVKTHEMVTLSATEVKKILSVIKNEEHHAFFKLAFASGLRRSELLGLAWSNVDFKKQTITVEQTVIRTGNDIILSKSTKNASSKRSIKVDTETDGRVKEALYKHQKANVIDI
jgi:integrase